MRSLVATLARVVVVLEVVHYGVYTKEVFSDSISFILFLTPLCGSSL